MRKRDTLSLALMIILLTGYASTQAWAQNNLIKNFSIHEIDVNNYILGPDRDDDKNFHLGGFSGLSYQYSEEDGLTLFTVTDKMKKDLEEVVITPKGPKLVQLNTVLNHQNNLQSVGIKSFHSFNFLPNSNSPQNEYINDHKIDPEAIHIEDQFLWIADEALPSIMNAPLSESSIIDINTIATAENLKLDQCSDARPCLPNFLKEIEDNAGFEAMTSTENSVYVFMQTSFIQEEQKDNTRYMDVNTYFIRVLKLNKETFALEALYLYPLSQNDSYIIDKISGATHINNNKLMIVEQNSKKKLKNSYKSIVTVDFSQASNVIDLFEQSSTQLSHQNLLNFEYNLALELENKASTPVLLPQKSPVIPQLELQFNDYKKASNTGSTSLTHLEKIEGITFVKELNTVFLINDNDYRYNPADLPQAKNKSYIISFFYEPK